ncbi:hypothetical protein TWF481_010602 [Arthrobotrys musiformis]|uniref:Cytochrome P450 n=1 Tax=Arthrobotrys musiformis TaxID=47236 RepID=A0AAV9W2M3_9PEZI
MQIILRPAYSPVLLNCMECIGTSFGTDNTSSKLKNGTKSPIIRTGPNELSINDPSFYNTLYAANYKFAPYPPHYAFSGSVDFTASITDPATHKDRRAILNRFFSKAKILRLSSTIQNNVREFVRVISESTDGKTSESGLCLSSLFRRLTLDVISEYAFSESFNTLGHGIDSPIAEGIKRSIRHLWVFNFIWPLQYLATKLPYGIASMLAPRNLSGAIDLQKIVGAEVDGFLKNFKAPKGRRVPEKSNHLTIFQSLVEETASGFELKSISSPKLSREFLVGEAILLLGAGMETTATLLSNVVYQACVNQSIQHNLHDELVKAFPSTDLNAIDYTSCENLPYLTACIKEGLRLTPSVPVSIPRVVPKDGTFCGKTYIPPGTVVSMSIYLMHQNPTVYKNLKVFDPDRWLNVSTTSPQERYFVPFSKGSKSCLGIYLAYAEIYVTLAALMRRFKFTLHKDNKLTENWVDHMVLDTLADLVVSVEEYDD